MKKILLILLVLSATKSFATQYFIQCGENHGLKYFPNTLTVAIGDTITWKGDFALFPFTSTVIPALADSFGANDGTCYSYVALIAGNYYYGCSSSIFEGTKGQFTVDPFSSGYIPIVTNTASSLYVQQVNGENILHSVLADSNAMNFIVGVFDLSGRAILKGNVSINVSGYKLPDFQRGIYIVMAIDSKKEIYATKIWQQ